MDEKSVLYQLTEMRMNKVISYNRANLERVEQNESRQQNRLSVRRLQD